MPDHLPVQTPPPDILAGEFVHAPPANDQADAMTADSPLMTYDVRTLTELEAIFGRAKLVDLLARLKDEIGRRLRLPVSERAALGRDAHTLLSASGSLGFVDLSRSCSALEQACLLGEDLAAPLEAALRAGRRSVEAIDRLCETG